MSHQKLVQQASRVGLITLVSRIFGYIRDAVLAGVLGAAYSMDAFTVAFRLANLFRRLVGEGSMTACFIPVFTKYQKEHNAKAVWDFTAKAFFTLGIILLALTIFTIVASPLLVRVMAPGFYKIAGKLAFTTFLNQLMAPYLLFIGLAALLMGVLNAHESFALSAFTPILLNLSIVAAAFLLSPYFKNPAVAVAIGVLIGGFLQFACQIPQAMRKGMHFKPTISFTHPAIRQMGRLLVPGLFGIGITQINLLVDSLIASFLKEGSVSSLYYANRLTELVLGVDAVSVATVILPSLSKAAHANEIGEVKKILSFGLRHIAFVTLPAAAALAVLARPIITVLFQHGRFTVMDTERTAFCLVFFSVGLFFISAIKVMAPAFYAFFDTKTPVRCAFVALGTNVVFNLVLMGPLGIGGIALATALASMVNFLQLYFLFARRHGGMDLKPALQSLGKILAATVAMAAVCWTTLRVVCFQTLYGKIEQAGALALAIGLGAGTYFLMSWILKVPELGELAAFMRVKKPVPSTE